MKGKIMSSGLVTTTQVTHASPAGVYAHTANRNWESNQQLLDDGGNPEVCSDIAKQLIYGNVGRKLKVSGKIFKKKKRFVCMKFPSRINKKNHIF